MARFKSAVAVLILSGAVVHCDRRGDDRSEMAPAPPSPATKTGPSEGMTPASGERAPGETRTKPAAEPLTDEQIVKVMALANMAEVDEGNFAKSKAQSPKVKAFAAKMVEHHGKGKEKGNELASKLNLKPTESPLSTELKRESESSLSALMATPAADFDRKYIHAQVEEHRKVLTTIDDKLIPNAKSPELKSLLQEMRGTVQAHLSEAQQIHQELAEKR